MLQGLPEECIHLCNYNATAGELEGAWKECIPYAEEIVRCASLGKDASDCCDVRLIITPLSSKERGKNPNSSQKRRDRY